MDTLKFVSAEEEFKKNPELKKEDLQHIRDWCSKQPHLPQKITDNELILFLHSNYYRLEPTKTTIENFYTCRTHVPEFFTLRDLTRDDLKMAMETLCVLPLEMRTKEGYSIMYARMIDLDIDKFIFNLGMRLYNMINDLWIFQSGTAKGHVLICDIHGIQMAHVLRAPPMSVKKYIYYLQEAMPLRIKSLHFLNTTSIIDAIMRLIKPFMKKEFFELLHFHRSIDTLLEFVPREALPNEPGGTGGPMSNMYDKVLDNLKSHQEYFLEEEKTMRVNEALRVGKAKTASDVFGIEGSFKKLDID